MTEAMPQWPHARGPAPDASAVIRQTPEDFQVDEQLGVEFSGAGEHVWLHIEKTGLTTHNVAQSLARVLECPQRDVGYSGLKDRQAVARQWFSLHLGVNADLESIRLDAGDLPGIEVLDVRSHHRKLRRSTHDANRFRLVLRHVQGDRDVINADLERVEAEGVPNYFGEQRFAGGRNLQLAEQLFAGRRMKRNQRSMVISAARSYLFNEVLGRRVEQGSWNCLLPGERAILDGSGSHFAVAPEEADDASLLDRLQRFDIHPSGPMPGRGVSEATQQALALEAAVLEPHAEWIAGLERLGVDASRRSLRMRPEGLCWHWPEDDVLVLEFSLPPGTYATTLLREVLRTDAGQESAAG